MTKFLSHLSVAPNAQGVRSNIAPPFSFSARAHTRALLRLECKSAVHQGQCKRKPLSTGDQPQKAHKKGKQLSHDLFFRVPPLNYARMRHLPALLHLFPSEITRLEEEQTGELVRRLHRALHAERKRGRTGHWRYSLSRHIGLYQALSAEHARLYGPAEREDDLLAIVGTSMM